MFKTVSISFLGGVILGGILWFSFGRSDIRQIRTDYDRSATNLERVQQNINKLSTDSDGFAGDIARLTETSKRITDRSGRIDKGLTGLNGNFGDVTIKVDELEKWNRRSLVLNRDFGDQLYELRQLNKTGGVQN